jgi:hypothetical protein
VLLLLVVSLLLTGYLVVRAVNLLMRVLARHPRQRALWIALGTCVGMWGLTALTGVLAATPAAAGWLLGIGAVSLILAVLSTAGLLVTARIVELHYDQLLQRQRTKETLIQDVLMQPWWSSAA